MIGIDPMTEKASICQNNIIQFPCKKPSASCLTKQDRQDASNFRVLAKEAGYDAIIVHVVSLGIGQGTMDYISVYRPEQAWSTWGFAREGNAVLAWNALTSKDAGTFATVWEALACVLVGDVMATSVICAEKN